MSLTAGVCLVTAVICAILWTLVEKRRLNRITHNVPTFSGELPVVGHALKLNRKDLLSFIAATSEEANRHDGIIKCWLGPKLFIGLSSPELIKSFSNTCLDKSFFYHFGKAVIGDGLLGSTGQTWKHHRRTLNPMFHNTVLEGFIPILNSNCARFVESLRNRSGRGEFNHWPNISNISLEMAYHTILGMSNTQQMVDGRTYAAALDNLTINFNARVQNMILYPEIFYNLSKTKRNFDENAAIVNNISSHAYSLKRCDNKTVDYISLDDSGYRFSSILDLMLVAEDRGLLSKQDIIEELNNLILAGYDTTANTLVYLLLVIGTYSDVQEKLLKELKEVFGESSCDVTKEDLSRLVYMDAVIQETLRMFSVVPLVARTVAKTVRVGDFIIPLGCDVFMLLLGINKHQSWGDPEVFRPDRFLNRETDNGQSKLKFYPFGAGRRNCIGKNYAMMSMKVLLCHLIRKYKLNGNMDNLKLSFEVILKPMSGFHISLESR